MSPGRADGEGLGGAGQWFVYTFEKSRCLGPDRLRFVVKGLKHRNKNGVTEQKQNG